MGTKSHMNNVKRKSLRGVHETPWAGGHWGNWSGDSGGKGGKDYHKVVLHPRSRLWGESIKGRESGRKVNNSCCVKREPSFERHNENDWETWGKKKRQSILHQKKSPSSGIKERIGWRGGGKLHGKYFGKNTAYKLAGREGEERASKKRGKFLIL